MEYLHPSSTPASKSELSIFSVPPTQVAIESYYDVEYRPSASLESSSVHEVIVPASEDFTDLSQSMVHCSLEIQDSNGVSTEIAKSVENFANSLFEQIDFFLGTINTSQATNMYHYQSYLEDLLFRHPTKADYGRLESAQTLRGRVDLYFRLHLPMCQQDRLLINGVPMIFRFTRSPDNFALHVTPKTSTPVTCKIKMRKLAVQLKRVKLFPDAQAGIISALNDSPAKYFIIRPEMKSFSIPKAILSATFENVFSGVLPRRVIIGFVDEAAFSGDINKDPYKFNDLNINQINLNVDGASIPNIPYTPSFPVNCVREFVELYRVLGQDEGVPQLDLSFESYKDKTTLFAFDLGGGLGGETGTLSLIRRGAVRVEVRMSTETSSSYKMIVFAQFDNLITIDKDRNVMLDY